MKFCIFIIQTTCIHRYSDHILERGTLDNQSRLSKNVSYQNIPGNRRKDIMDVWIKTIGKPFMFVLLTLQKIPLMKVRSSYLEVFYEHIILEKLQNSQENI